MFIVRIILVIISASYLYSCNSGKSEEEMEELWSKAQTTGKIIERSGTKFNSGVNKERALRDAETRLQTGGGLFGKKGLAVGDIFNPGAEENKNNSVGTIAMSINAFLWQGALDTVSFMPLNSADPIGGTIITDWYSTSKNPDERCKLNIYISGTELKTQNLKVASFCQEYKNQRWINIDVNNENNIKLENAILNKAKKLKLQLS